MFIVQDYSIAVLFCIVTMLCWGSWANTQKLVAGNWRFELFYWDYVFGIILFSLLLALTFGSVGEGGRPFLADIQQASSPNITSAIVGGVVFNLANILLVAAISIAGMSVAFPVGIGLALTIGVIVNYLQAPVGDKTVLFGGVALIVIAILLNAYAYRRMMKNKSGISTKGLVLSIVSGCLMGLFYKYVAASMYSDFNVPEPGKLGPYTAVFIFSLGIGLSNIVFNSVVMARPFTGEPVKYSQYFQGSAKNHLMGILGGSIWCLGMSFSIIASGKAGPAISYGLGQGATIIAALWGIYVWKEFRDSPKGVNTVLRVMLLLYIIGLALIIMAR